MAHKQLVVDLNADMGESFGAWAMGQDSALLQLISSANIACGFHAGDPDVMMATMLAAHKQGVGIGAHPGFADLQGFGRNRMYLPHAQLANLVRYQVAAADGMARSIQAKLAHIKLHGALANMASTDLQMALVCYRAALSVAPHARIMVMAQTEQQAAAQQLGCDYAVEIFADRAYNDDATLVDRAQEGAVIHDPQRAAERVVAMLEAGAIICASGKHIPTRIDTICMHGDTAEAVEIAKAVRKTLGQAGIAIQCF